MKPAANRRATRIFSRYKRTRSPILRNSLLEHYMPLVNRCAERLRMRLPACVQVEDLISAGVFGLSDALESYNIDRQVLFSTFSARRIHGSMLDELRAMDWVPRQVRKTKKALANATRELEADRGRRPSDEEMADTLHLPIERYAKLARDARGTLLLPLDQTFRPSPDGCKDEGRQLPDPRTPDPVREQQKRHLKELVTQGLSRAERLIVILYYYESLSMREIGLVLDLSESRVSQMHSLILIRLRARLTEAALQEHAG